MMSSGSSTTSSMSEDELKALLNAPPLESEASQLSFCTANYHPSLVAIAAFGLLNSLNMYLMNFKSWPSLLSGIIAFLESTIVFEWFHLHGMKLTREERLIFDEKNILETTRQLDYNLPPVLDDLTPGDIPEERKSILADLFRNEKDEEMQRWYKLHYGKVYENAMRTERQEKMMQQLDKPTKNIKN